MKISNKTIIVITLIFIVGAMSVIYAALSSSLNINSTANVGSNMEFDIKLQGLNCKVVKGTGANTIAGDITTTAATSVTTSGTVLYSPGDEVKCTFKAVNNGNIDVILDAVDVDSITNSAVTYTDGSTLSTADQELIEDYVTYTFDDNDSKDIIENNDIKATATEADRVLKSDGGVKQYKIIIKFSSEATNLPSKSILMEDITSNLLYIQTGKVGSDPKATDPEGTPVSFASDSWAIIKEAVQTGDTSKYNVGDTKCVHLEGFTTTNNNGCNGDFKVRIANKSACTTETSETACGFVLEFVDIITRQKMNSTNTNVGGWEDSEMRSYVNSTIYNALPSDLKSVIADTTVVSGHGSTSGESNFTTTDKLYLLSAHEVWNDETSNPVSSYDTAYNETRQLDYYANLGVTTSNYSGAIKQDNRSNTYWWLRSAASTNGYYFLNVGGIGGWYGSYANITGGVSAAFRIE